MIVKLLIERHLEFLSLKGGCRGSSESTLVKMSNCWKSHALAHLVILWEHRSCQCINDLPRKERGRGRETEIDREEEREREREKDRQTDRQTDR